MQSDPITDLLVRIKNGYLARKAEVEMPHSRIKEEILKQLKEFGFVGEYMVVSAEDKKSPKQTMTVELRYDQGTTPAMENFKRVSKPSLRRYIAADQIRPVMDGFGLLIVSTSHGVMAGHEARQKKLGGEVIAEIW